MIAKNFRLFCYIVLGICLLNVSECYATSAPNPVASPQKLDLGALGPSSQKPKVKRVVEHTFSQMTYEGLYKLAWSYEAFSSENTEALNTYLMITECNLYNKFFSNEFEWEKIKIATKDFLKKNKGKVTRYYEYVQPIYMGRYDYSLQGFPIVSSESFKGLKNLQFASYPSGSTSCGGYSINPMTYPSTGVLTISSPLNLSFVRVPLALAQKYVEWRAKQGKFDDEKRQAYIRYRFRIDGYEGIKGFVGMKAFGFNGKLMRLDVFADQEMLLPLYNQVF